jgi:hypothetical protein
MKYARMHTLRPEPWSTVVAADSGGVVAALLRRPKDELDHWLKTDDLRRRMIMPTLTALVKMLSRAEAYGRAAFDTWICVPKDVNVETSPQQTAGVTREIHISGELTIPADDEEVGALGSQWEREFARNFGITSWEG